MGHISVGTPTDNISVETGMVLYLPGPPGSGGTIFDYSGNGNHGTINGATWYTLPSGEKCLSFDGLDDYMSVGDKDLFSFGNGTIDSPFSMSAWVNMTDATNFTVFSKGMAGAYEYLFRAGDSLDKLSINLFNPAGSTALGRVSAALTAYQGIWIFITVTYDGSSTNAGLKLYLNGNRVDNANDNLGTYVAMNNTISVLEMGRMWGTTPCANGLTDKGCIYNRALSAPEILYNHLSTKWRYQ